MPRIHTVAHDDLAAEDTRQTAGMQRLEATLAEEVRAVEVHTAPGMVSGWHHHGDHATYGWVVSGRLRFESGPGGREVVDVGPGDFFFVPPHTVHRESNPTDEGQVLVGLRVGSGPTVVNVDGPPG